MAGLIFLSENQRIVIFSMSSDEVWLYVILKNCYIIVSMDYRAGGIYRSATAQPAVPADEA